jgi:hypothetical protein
MDVDQSVVAVCGLDCGVCPLRTAHVDPAMAGRLVGWFRDQDWLKAEEGVTELMARGPYCSGCRGDRSVHWSANCWILHCCADDKGLDHCYQCDAFPCPRLEMWADGSQEYTQALERLHVMREEQDA